MLVRSLIVLLTFAAMGLVSGHPPNPHILPLETFYQGNKPRQPYKGPVDRSGSGLFQACEERIRSWNTWSGGLTGTVQIKALGAPAMTTWSAILQMDRDVKDFRSYDSQVQELNKRTFILTPLSWNGEVAEAAERMVNVQLAWDQGGAEPRIQSLSVNGETFTCMETQESGGAEAGPPPEAAGSNPQPVSTTSRPPQQAADRGVFVPWPKRVMGLYVLLADDSEAGFESHVEWHPKLYPYMQEGANVLFFTFIHPVTMDVPPAYKNLAATRGTDQPGAVPKDTVILFAIGGYAYSIGINPWPWLQSKEAAEAMAEKVAQWPEKYGCDGIDLDIEDGAGNRVEAGPNMIHFVRRLRELQPKMIVGQPTYGYPAINAEIDVINASWDDKGNNKNLADEIGLMVYEGTQSLNYVKNYVNGAGQWQGFPIKVNAPTDSILLGVKGSTQASDIDALVDATLKNNYRGIMVWYASVVDGLQYAKGSWDASTAEATQKAYIEGLRRLRSE